MFWHYFLPKLHSNCPLEFVKQRKCGGGGGDYARWLSSALTERKVSFGLFFSWITPVEKARCHTKRQSVLERTELSMRQLEFWGKQRFSMNSQHQSVTCGWEGATWGPAALALSSEDRSVASTLWMRKAAQPEHAN